MIFITGSNGFVGVALKECLASRDIPFSCYESNGLDYFDSDYDWTTHLSGVKCVVHLANTAHGKSNSKDQIFSNNIDGTLNLLRFCIINKVKKFIFVSTANKFKNEKLNGVESLQTRSKKIVEEKIIQAAKGSDVEVIIIKSPMVYASHAPGNCGLLSKYVKYIPITPFGRANNKIDIVSLDRLVVFILRCSTFDISRGVVFISDPKPLSTRDLMDLLANLNNVTIYHLPIPRFFIRILCSACGKRGIYNNLYENNLISTNYAHPFRRYF